MYIQPSWKKLHPQKDKNYTDVMKTRALKNALNKYNYDIIYGGARRDEEPDPKKELSLLGKRVIYGIQKIKNLNYGAYTIMKKMKIKRLEFLSNWTE